LSLSESWDALLVFLKPIEMLIEAGALGWQNQAVNCGEAVQFRNCMWKAFEKSPLTFEDPAPTLPVL
jgi:hypothetical protein